METLKMSCWFMFCSEETLRLVAMKMMKEEYQTGDIIIHEGEPTTRLLVVAKGSVDRM